MGYRRLLYLLSLGLTLSTVRGDAATEILATAETNTECKTCPHSLCSNTLYYSYDEPLNVTCWTRGTRIIDTSLWLRSTSDCYVTEYDLTDNVTDWTSALSYCGENSEDENLTLEDATTKYKTECRICTSISCDTVAYLREDTDLELTCWTPTGQVIIDDPYWMKTTNNCYVAQKNLYSKPDITYLTPCGPIPFLELANHFNENGTSEVDKRAINPREGHGVMAPAYLINVTVGEEYAYCRTCAEDSCRAERRYVFDQEVWLQCLVNTNGTWWSETTDFCYVKNSDFWQYPEGDCKFRRSTNGTNRIFNTF